MIRSTSRAITWQDRHRLPAQIALVLLSLVLLTGCSLRSMAVGAMADAMARPSTVYARDDDPEFVREALPFGLKTMEGLLLEKPRHKGLLLSACSGFTQYAQAFVVLPADRLEETDLTAARAERRRAARLFLRARGYCVRALEVVYPGLVEELSSSPKGPWAGPARRTCRCFIGLARLGQRPSTSPRAIWIWSLTSTSPTPCSNALLRSIRHGTMGPSTNS